MLILMEARRNFEKAFSNRDIYFGEFKEVLPHGKGKYTWSDGKIYEGDWEEGTISGNGKLVWPSGSRYEGGFSGGYLHGFGMFTSPDGSVYSGAWRMNVRHGLGRKGYSNLDTYDGLWKEGVQEGSGSYSWTSGNTYTGNWKNGMISGRGVMTWANGDIFDGFWLNGFRHGSGVYKFADGGFYFGTWNRGLKDGNGIFYPAGSKHPSLKQWYRSLDYDDSGNFILSRGSSTSVQELRLPKPAVTRNLSKKNSISGILRNSDQLSGRVVGQSWGLYHPTKEFISRDSSHKHSQASDAGQGVGLEKDNVVYEREYMQGVLIRERVLNYADLPLKAKQIAPHTKVIKTWSCMAFFGGTQSYYLMLNLQFGIRYTLGKMNPVSRREVRASDFGDRARIKMFFPKEGSQFTPPHKSVDFYWHDYCPMIFRNLREMFKLDAADYMMSICGDDGLREISSTGKSGSLFYLSEDERFVIKTLKKSELKVLLNMLPSYYSHVGDYENTLITKFFGVHGIKWKWGKKVRFVVMGNMFCTELKIHRRYDLKGSSQGRFTDKNKIKEKTTLKDLDLSYNFHMDKLLRESLFEQMFLDTKFLESQNIIDYSLLLGLHFRAPKQLDGLPEPPSSISDQDTVDSVDVVSAQAYPPKNLILVTHEPNAVNTAPGPHIRGSTLRAFSLGQRAVDLLLPGTGRLRVQLGVNMPAQANHKLHQDEIDSSAIELFEVYDVVLYMGVIDILQAYNTKKKAEHKCKSLRYDSMTISAVEPKLYAKRFISFLQKVFPEES